MKIAVMLIASSLFFPSAANASRDPAGWEFSTRTYTVEKKKINRNAARIHKKKPRYKDARGLSPRMQRVVAKLRAKHGSASVQIVAGRSYRYVAGTRRLSCHASGEAVDVQLSLGALRDVRADRRLGVISYSGAMRHVHVSVCQREAGYRGHKFIRRTWPVRTAQHIGGYR